MSNIQFIFLVAVIVIGFYCVHKELRWIRHAVRGEATNETMRDFYKVLLGGRKELREEKENKQNKSK